MHSQHQVFILTLIAAMVGVCPFLFPGFLSLIYYGVLFIGPLLPKIFLLSFIVAVRIATGIKLNQNKKLNIWAILTLFILLWRFVSV